MRMIRFLLTAAAAAALLHAQDFTTRADKYINPLVEQNQFIGSVLVARDGKPIFRKGFGLADREWNIPNGPDTKFRLGSITKQFTATAILQLVEAGKLKTEDPVSKYYTDAPASWSKITIHNLLTHTSGIPSYTEIPGFFQKQAMFDLTPAEIVKLTEDKPLDFEPGEKWKYDNSGYILLGYVIEKVSGQTYADYIRQHIFEPLGMHDTGYDNTKDILPHRASGYVYQGGRWQNAPYLAMTLPYAAGSLYSTVDDLLIWDQALYAGKPLTAASFEKMFTPYKNGYGYGWGIGKQFDHKQISHGGGINGFSTVISRFPDDKVTVIVLSNMQSPAVGRIGSALAGMVFGIDPVVHSEIKIESKLLDDYAGVYTLPPGAFTIARDGDRLMGGPEGQRAQPLIPYDRDKFFVRAAETELEFRRDPQGKVIELVVRQNGDEIRGARK
ncbi:Beta-lactamase (fragment) [Candidatus Sulfopaludibacter sp. SbA4]